MTPGIYRLQVNSQYTPSNDDVATFVDTIQVLGTSKTTEQRHGNTSSSIANKANIETKLKQQPVTTSTGSFKIIVQVNKVNNNKHDKMVFVTGNPSILPLKFAQSKLIPFDPSKAVTNSAYPTTFELPKDTVKVGDKFMACLISLQPPQLPVNTVPIICKTGINSPASKPELIIFTTNGLPVSVP